MYKKKQKLFVTYYSPDRFHNLRDIGLLHSDWLCAARSSQYELMPARERWSRENPGSRRGLHSTTVAGGRGGGRGVGGEGEGCKFSYLLESDMTYLAGSHVLRRRPGIRLIHGHSKQRTN